MDNSFVKQEKRAVYKQPLSFCYASSMPLNDFPQISWHYRPVILTKEMTDLANGNT
jgi:hypothetical protein